jgi:hypothetical protein
MGKNYKVKCAGCGNEYDLGVDAVAVPPMFGMKEDMIAAVVDRDKAEFDTTWEVIDSIETNPSKQWRCRDCDHVNSYF